MRLRVFLYLLLRDHVSFGVAEKIMADVERAGIDPIMSENLQDQYAVKLADRLR